MRFDGVAVKISAMLDQVHEVDPDGDLVEPSRGEHVVAIQSAIGKAFWLLAGDATGSETCLAQSAGCPVCGLSDGLVDQPLSIAPRDAIEDHEESVNELLEQLKILQALAPKSRTLKLV